MKQYNDIGNGDGWVYVTEPDGTTIVKNIPNLCEATKIIKLLGIEAAAPSGNLISFGIVEITEVSGTNNVTGILVAGVNQMSEDEDVTGLSKAQLATAITNNINAFTPATGIDYTASAVDVFVYLFAGVDDGSAPNGNAVVFATDDPANIAADTTDFSGGADSNKIYDESNGFRFFLDADYAASSTSCSGDGTAVQGDLSNAIEITNDVIILQGSNKIITVTIANDAISPTRTGREYDIELGTEGAAATDDLITINPAGHSSGDIIRLRGADPAKIVTVKTTGNIDLEGGSTFDTGDYGKTITLQLFKKGGAANDLWYWFEVSRSTQSVASVADFRTNDFPFISTEGRDTIALVASGTINLEPNTDKKLQETSGTVTLTNLLEIVISTGAAIAGDIFNIVHKGGVTIGVFDFKIAGIKLTANQALQGGWVIQGYYDGSSWRPVIFPIFNQDANPATIENDQIKTGTIEIQKMEAAHQKSSKTVPLSFETGYVGAQKAPMAYPGTVNKITAYITKDIESSNDASIIIKDNAGVAMGAITITAGATIGNAFTVSPTTNNTFVTDDVLTFETAKTTKGGEVNVFIDYTRT